MSIPSTGSLTDQAATPSGVAKDSPVPIVLVIPPSPFLLDQRVFPFLGVLKVAAALREEGWPVEVLDLSGVANFLELARDCARQSSASVFGLTATTPQFPGAVTIAEAIRSIKPDARIILGGTHATLVVAAKKAEAAAGRRDRAHRAWERMARHFDTIVAGDGEIAIFAAAQPGAPKLIDGDDRRSALFLNKAALAKQPLPARDLIDLASYRYTIDGLPAQSLIAQLGCPYHCGFCAGRSSPMLRHIRTRDDEAIVAELEHLHGVYGTQGFMFYDDELNVNPGMAALMERIAEAQRRLGVTWRLRGFIKSERFTDAQAGAMVAAGFREILVGFESGSPRILANIQKIATVEDNTRCFEIARRHGLRVKALMSLGHPGESPETVADTARWLEAMRPADFDVTIITPYPGSPYYDLAAKGSDPQGEEAWIYTSANGDRLYQDDVDYTRDADYYKGDPEDGYVSHVWTDFLAREGLVAARDRLEVTLREKLAIPFNTARPAQLYEASMGQMPAHVLKK